MKDVLTTSEAAKLCRISQQTMIRCFDAGRIKGFRVPGSRFRRIPRAEVIRFAAEFGISINLADASQVQVLIISTDRTILDAVVPRLQRDLRFGIRVAESSFEAGVAVFDQRPQMVVLDSDSVGANAANVLGHLRRQLPEASILYIPSERDRNGEVPLGTNALLIPRPVTGDELFAQICRCLEDKSAR